MDMSKQLMKWDDGEMAEQEEIEFFQLLVDQGAAWHMPPIYGRRAKQLIDEGKVSPYGSDEDFGNL